MPTQDNRTDAQNPFAAWPMAAFQSTAASCVSALEHGNGLQSEWMRFIQKRLGEDGHLPEKLMNCKTPADFLQVQVNFVNDFFKDYAQEFQKMGEMMRNATNDSLATAQKSATGGVSLSAK